MHSIKAKFAIDNTTLQNTELLQRLQVSLAANKSILIADLYETKIIKMTILQSSKDLISVNIQMNIDESHMSDELAMGIIEENLRTLETAINKHANVSGKGILIKFVDCSAAFL